jgi:hypothetical protein
MPRLDHQIVKMGQWYWSSSSNKVLEASGLSHQPCGSPCNGGINNYKFESNLKPKNTGIEVHKKVREESHEEEVTLVKLKETGSQQEENW